MIKLQPKLTKKKLQLSTGNQGLKTKSLQHQGFQVAGRGRKLITKQRTQAQDNNICKPICIKYHFNRFQNHVNDLIVTFRILYFLYIKQKQFHHPKIKLNKKQLCAQ